VKRVDAVTARRHIRRVPAVYRARSAFPNYFGAPINRLAPLAGVLDYDAAGHVVDLQAAR